MLDTITSSMPRRCPRGWGIAKEDTVLDFHEEHGLLKAVQLAMHTICVIDQLTLD